MRQEYEYEKEIRKWYSEVDSQSRAEDDLRLSAGVEAKIYLHLALRLVRAVEKLAERRMHP